MCVLYVFQAMFVTHVCCGAQQLLKMALNTRRTVEGGHLIQVLK